MNTSATGECVRCGIPTTKRCSKCSEGVDIDGNVTRTYYCGKTCQEAGFKTHISWCRNSNARKQLYRGGELLQALFYALREILFDIDVLAVDIEEKLIHLHQSYLPNEAIPFPCVAFPHRLVQKEEDKAALLAYVACTDALVLFDELVKKNVERYEPSLRTFILTKITGMPGICNARKGAEDVSMQLDKTCRRIVNHKPFGVDDRDYPHIATRLMLGDGNEFFLDLSGAQYGQYRPVIPAIQYEKLYFPKGLRLDHICHFGTAANNRRNVLSSTPFDCLRHHYHDYRVILIQAHVAGVMNVTVTSWEKEKKTSLAAMLRAGQSNHEAGKEEILKLATEAMKAKLSWFKSSPGLRYLSTGVRPSDNSMKHFGENVEEVENELALLQID